MFAFQDKVVLLTGATGGLGRELARRLAVEGALLIVTGRTIETLQEVVTSLPDPTRATAIDGTLSEPGEAARLAAAAEAVHDRVDVLINNAGMGYFALVEEATDERIRELFELNTFAPLTLMRKLVPGMMERGEGLVVNVASAAGRVPIPTVGIYGGSKSALAIIANTMRFELEPRGVRIVNVYPGTTDTAFEINALRENDRDGLYGQSGYQGEPVDAIVDRIMRAAREARGEVWLEREGKWLSAGALVWPAWVERKLRPLRDRALAYGEFGKPHDERRWQLWQVESAFCCNLDCVMCPWAAIRADSPTDGLMGDAVWDAVVPHLPEIASLDFSGGGEPLQNPALAARIAQAKDAGCRAGFLTNGMLLDEDRCDEILAADPDWITFSVDGASAATYESIRRGASFDRMTANIRRVARRRTDGRPRLGLNFVLMRENVDELPALVRLAAELGIDVINIKQCDVSRGEDGAGLGLFGATEDAEVAAARKAVEAARKLAGKLGLESRAAAFTPDEQPVCDQDPRTSLFLRHDGRVAPCINHAYGGPTTFLGEPGEMPSVHYGTFPGDDVMDVWETAACRRYRELFAQRVATYNQRLVTGGLGSSIAEMEEAFEEARRAMPAPPSGCERCHYLYGL